MSATLIPFPKESQMSLIARGFAAVIITAVVTGMVCPPASASKASAAQLSVFLPDVNVAADSIGTLTRVTVMSSERVTATNLRLEIDYAGLISVATVTPTSGGSSCSTSLGLLTCVYESAIIGGPTGLLPELRIKPIAGRPVGTSGNWRVTVAADGLAPARSEAKVQIVDGVDLGVPNPNAERQGTPGGAVPQTLEVDNVGELAADGAVAVFFGDYDITTTKEYSNCTFDEGQPTSCTFDEQLAPGNGYRTSEEFPFKLRPDTLAPGGEFLGVRWMTKADFVLLRTEMAALGSPDFFGQPGSGGKLSLVARAPSLAKADQTDINSTNDWFFLSIEVEGDNDADFAATGGAASGAVGQVVTLNLGFKNLGPAARDDNGVGGGVGTVDIALPPGSSLASMPESCIAMTSVGDLGEADPDRGNLAARFIRCTNPSTLVLVGDEVAFPVKLKIDQVISGAAGSVAIRTGNCDTCRRDKNPSNDTASVVLNPPQLPTTGVQTGLIAGSGVLLALAGLAAFVLGRRRFNTGGKTD